MTCSPPGVLLMPGRVLVRSLPANAPHFWRDNGQWVCRARLGPWGYGETAEAAYEHWKRARMQWAHDIPPARPLMARVGHFPLTESTNVH